MGFLTKLFLFSILAVVIVFYLPDFLPGISNETQTRLFYVIIAVFFIIILSLLGRATPRPR